MSKKKKKKEGCVFKYLVFERKLNYITFGVDKGLELNRSQRLQPHPRIYFIFSPLISLKFCVGSSHTPAHQDSISVSQRKQTPCPLCTRFPKFSHLRPLNICQTQTEFLKSGSSLECVPHHNTDVELFLLNIILNGTATTATLCWRENLLSALPSPGRTTPWNNLSHLSLDICIMSFHNSRRAVQRGR